VLKEVHNGPTGGNFSGETTTNKILRVDYYWLNMFRDAHTRVRTCKVCLLSAGKENKASISLQPVKIYRPFEQWGIDVIGEINPNSPKQHKYILTTIYYFT
jgi:hypothetical protein